MAPVAPAAPADAHVEPWHIAWAPDGARLPINRQLDVNDAGQLINRHRSVVSVVDVSAALAGDVNATELFVAAPFSSESDWAVYHGLQWDPSGRAVHLVVGPMVDKDRVAYLDGPGDLVGVGLDGVVATVAQAGEDSVQGVKFPIGAWSADGSRLAWLARRLAPRTPAVVPYPPPVPGTTAASSAWPSRALIIADSDGTGARALDNVPYARLLWAPNGSALAYRPARPGADDQLRSEERRLVRPGQAPVLGELAR